MTALIDRKPLTHSLLDKEEFLSPFSNLFNDFFNDSFDFLGKDFFDNATYPKVDVKEDSNNLIIEAEIPGISRNQISLEIDGNWLRLKGEKKLKNEVKNQVYIHRELKHSAFCRSFKLPENVDKDKLSAKFENGVLEISLPKKIIESPPSATKMIEIK